MKAAVFRGVRTLQVEEVAEPECGPEDVVVEVRAVGVCGSDLHTYLHGSFVQPGQIMGHEFAAEVVQAGEAVTGLQVGDRLTASPLVPCQACPRCAEGRYNLCVAAWTQGLAYGRPGAFAERLAIPRAVVGENVFPLDGAISDEAGALVEPLAVAVHAVRLAGPVEGATALVLGLGTIGLQVVQALRARGIGRVLGADLSEVRRSAASQLGAEALDGAELDAALERALGGGEIDVVFECTGVPALLAGAVERVRGGGTIVVLALFDDPAAIDATMLVQKEIRMQGSIAYTSEDFAEAVELLRTGRAVAEPLVTHRHALDDIDEAFRDQLEKDRSIKVLVRP